MSYSKDVLDGLKAVTQAAQGLKDDSVDSSWIQTTEHINLDPSSIYLTSNHKISNFNPAGSGNESFLAESIEEKTPEEQLTTEEFDSAEAIPEAPAELTVFA